jgi:hypothetical protein
MDSPEAYPAWDNAGGENNDIAARRFYRLPDLEAISFVRS